MADIDFEEVQLGTAPTGVGGDVPRTAFGKITRNFNKIKAFFADSSNAASRKVGSESGDVMEVGAFGPGAASPPNLDDAHAAPATGIYRMYNNDNQPEGPNNTVYNMVAIRAGSERFAGLFAMDARYSPNTFYGKTKNNEDEWEPWVTFLTTGNTTTDSNGFIKEASPIIKLFDDKIEKTNHLEIQSAALEKLGTGKYKLTGVPELSRDGWYIETPRDRNGNVYFTIDYKELDGELIIKTYEPDYSIGRAENGAPVDILEGRFVSLRFAENPELYPEPEDEQE